MKGTSYFDLTLFDLPKTESEITKSVLQACAIRVLGALSVHPGRR